MFACCLFAGSDPCGPINPCGQGECRVVNGTNQCKCSRGFVAVTNIDGSQSCSPGNTTPHHTTQANLMAQC